MIYEEFVNNEANYTNLKKMRQMNFVETRYIASPILNHVLIRNAIYIINFAQSNPC